MTENVSIQQGLITAGVCWLRSPGTSTIQAGKLRLVLGNSRHLAFNSDVQQSLCVLVSITVIYKTQRSNYLEESGIRNVRIFLGEWTHEQQYWEQGRRAWCDKEERRCLSPAEVLWSALLSGTKTHKEQLDMVESRDDYMQRQLSLKGATQTAGSFSLLCLFKAESFLMLASASTAGENSVTTRPCQQHRLASEYCCVPRTDKNSKICCLLLFSRHTVLSLIESRITAVIAGLHSWWAVNGVVQYFIMV